MNDEVPADVAGAPTLPFQRILITGAYGFVGRHLVPALARTLQAGARLVLAGRSGETSFRHGHASILLDLEDMASITHAIRSVRPDLVVHLAGQASVGRSANAAAVTWSVNVCGTLALARAMAELVPDCAMLFASSVEVYGLTFNEGIASETSPLRPQSSYARSKAAAEAMLADVLPPTAPLIVARPGNHSGPGQDEAFVIPAFAAQIARIEAGVSTQLHVGNLDAERDFLDVRDVVDAYLALLMQATRLPARTTFNIASGHPVRVGEVLHRLCALSTTDIAIRQDPKRMRPSEVLRATVTPSAIHHAVGWTPRHSLDDMLASVLADQRIRLRGTRPGSPPNPPAG